MFGWVVKKGTKNTRYEHIDYYDIYPVDTVMRLSYEAGYKGFQRNEKF